MGEIGHGGERPAAVGVALHLDPADPELPEYLTAKARVRRGEQRPGEPGTADGLDAREELRGVERYRRLRRPRGPERLEPVVPEYDPNEAPEVLVPRDLMAIPTL